MTEKDYATLQRELAELRRRVAELEAETQAAAPPGPDWTHGFYLSYYATTGFFLGMIAAVVSLAFNVVGALLTGLHPLQLIRVYLTFGLGERALELELDKGDGGLALIIGCCLYIATGMLLGVVFQVALSSLAGRESLGKRLLFASLMGLAVWVVNYYGVLYWLQPLLFGDRWIVTKIPVWVAALTHLVFAWTMALLYPLGTFQPYRPESE